MGEGDNRPVRLLVLAAASGLVIASGATAVSSRAAGGATTSIVSSSGIAGVRFGTPKPRAVRELASRLGSPTARFVSNGCGPSYTEVEWGHLYVEFRRGRLTGFRYLRGGWEGRAVKPGRVLPTLVTSKGVSLASTLAQVRDGYRTLKVVGTDRWQSRDGLVFYVSYLVTQPPPPESRITEIKYGTCGDW